MKNQFEVYTSVQDNFATAIKATETALHSQGSAVKENEAYMQSLEAKIAGLKAQFSELAINTINSDMLKALVSVGTGLLKLANSDIGQTIIQIVALTTVLGLVSLGFKKFNNSVKITSLKGEIQAFAQLRKEFGLWQALDATFLINPVTLAVAGIAAMVGVYKVAKNFSEAYTESVDKQKEVVKNAATELENLATQYDELKKTASTESDKAHLTYLENVIKANERILQQEAQKALILEFDTANPFTAAFTQDDSTQTDTLQASVKWYEEINKKRTESLAKIRELSDMDGLYGKDLEKRNKQLKDEKDNYGELTSEMSNSLVNYDAIIQRFDELESSGANLTQEQYQLKNALIDIVSQSGDVVNIFDDMIGSGDGTASKINELTQEFDELTDTLKSATNAQETFDAALEGGDYGDALAIYKGLLEDVLDDVANAGKGNKAFWQVAEQTLGLDYLKEVSFNFDTVNAKLKTLQKYSADGQTGIAAFANELLKVSENGKVLDDLGNTIATVNKSGAGVAFDFDNENISALADKLNLSEEYLVAMLEAGKQFANINFENLEEVTRIVGELESTFDGADGKAYTLYSTIQGASGKTAQEIYALQEELEKTGVSIVDLSSDADTLATQFSAMDSTLMSFDSATGTYTANLQNMVNTLLAMGATEGEISNVVSNLMELGNVSFNDTTINAENVKDKISTIKDEYDATKDAALEADTKNKFENSIKSAKDLVTEIQRIQTTLNTLPTTKTITFNLKQNGAAPDRLLIPTPSGSGGIGSFAEGGVSQGGKTLVGEEAPELVQSGNRAYLVGKNGAEIVNLKKNDRVFNASDTKRILSGANFNSIQAGASGLIPSSTVSKGSKKTVTASTSKPEDTAKKIKKTTDDAKKAAKKLAEEFSHQTDILEHQLFLLEQTEGSEEDQINKMRELQAETQRQADVWREKGYEETSDEIMALQKQWWGYYQDIKDLEKDRLEDLKKTHQEALENSMDIYDAQMQALDWYVKEQEEAFDVRISEKDAEIQAEKDLNDERAKAVELEKLENDLAKAKNQRIKVYRAGQGFVYEQDYSAVSEAQDALNEFKEDEKYNNKIDRLEKEKEKEALEDQKDAYSQFANEQKELQDKVLLEDQLGMTLEDYYNTNRINNLISFKNQYVQTIKELIAAQQQLNNIDATDSSGNSTGKTVAVTSSGKAPQGLSVGDKVLTGGGTFQVTGVNEDGTYKSKKVDDYKYKKYADGTRKTSLSEWANVNEDGDEMIIPPSGNLQYLQKGTGVIPKTLTENLMDIGKMGINGLKNFAKNHTQSSTVHNNFDKIVLPNVTDAKSFIEELSNFKNLAIQDAYRRG